MTYDPLSCTLFFDSGREAHARIIGLDLQERDDFAVAAMQDGQETIYPRCEGETQSEMTKAEVIDLAEFMVNEWSKFLAELKQ